VGHDSARQNLLLHIASPSYAQSTPPYSGPIGAENEITAIYADEAPRIDGVLDEALWQRAVPAGFRTDNSKLFSTNGNYSWAEYFGGTRENWSGGFGLRTGKYLNMEVGISHNQFDLPITNGKFDATTISSNINMAWSRDLFAKALIQYDNFSGNIQANIRIDWIQPEPA